MVAAASPFFVDLPVVRLDFASSFCYQTSMKKRAKCLLVLAAFISTSIHTLIGGALDEWSYRTNGVRYQPYLGYNAVAYGAGRFVAFGVERAFVAASFVHSTNGLDWSEISPPPIAFSTRRIHFLNDRFIAISGSRVSHSTNGLDWVFGQITNGPSSGAEAGIAYGNGRYLVVANVGVGNPPDGYTGFAFASTNLVDWSRVQLHEYFEARDVAFGNGCFVAVGRRRSWFNTSAPVAAYVSENGVHWTPSGQTNNMYGPIAFGDGRFVVPALGGIYYSTNGIDWRWVFGPGGGYFGITYGNGTYVAVGGYGGGYPESGGHFIAYSTNATNWQRVNTLGDFPRYSEPYIRAPLVDVVFGQGSFVAVGGRSGPNAIWQSGNVLTPRIERTLGGRTNNLTFDLSGEFGREHVLQTSPDLETWEDLITYTNHLPTVRVSLPEPISPADTNRFFRSKAR
jgi:hypothetical protein